MFAVLMDHQVTVEYSDGSGRDSGGGTELAWTTRDTGVPCLLNVSGGGERDQFAQQQIPNVLRGATFYAGMQRGDRVTVTAGPSLVGEVLRVTGLQSQPGVDFLGIETLYYFTAETLQ